MRDAIVIGRHAGAIPFNIVEQKAVTFPTTAEECIPVLEELFEESLQAKAALIFQNTPGPVTAALTRIASRNTPTHIAVGVVITKVGVRESKVLDITVTPEIQEAVRFVNPNARIENTSITVDPPMKFEFSHIEWLFA